MRGMGMGVKSHPVQLSRQPWASTWPSLAAVHGRPWRDDAEQSTLSLWRTWACPIRDIIDCRVSFFCKATHFCPVLLAAKIKHRFDKALLFTQKQVLGPRTVKSQPIWVKFCTHLLLYGIHLWADLDRDRRVDCSRPNQKRLCFCNTCNAP